MNNQSKNNQLTGSYKYHSYAEQDQLDECAKEQQKQVLFDRAKAYEGKTQDELLDELIERIEQIKYDVNKK
jgi:predicted HTH domain antitoxin